MKMRRRWPLLFAAVIMVAGLIIFHSRWLSAVGHYLVVSDPIAPADAVVVLNGDSRQGDRLVQAVELWRTGIAPQVVVSVTLADWQTPEDDPTWRHAVKLGLSPSKSLHLIPTTGSTVDEAKSLLPALQHLGYRRVIIVTSNYHSRRAKSIFQKQWARNDLQFTLVAAPDRHFHPDSWWTRRMDSRNLYFEFNKILWNAIFE